MECGGLKLLLIEAFYTGSHKQLIDIVAEAFPRSHLVTLPGTKWHWRARTSALAISQDVSEKLDQAISAGDRFDAIFASSTLNLAELVGLCPQLVEIKKILFFHENQLIYPVREQKQRDFHYGYAQILSCMVADEIWFNSRFNLNSFVNGLTSFRNIIPAPKIRGVREKIEPKCKVVYYPVEIPHESCMAPKAREPGPLRILWPHRWEHDKNPQDFFQTLFDLHAENVNFEVFLLGERTNEIPPVFTQARSILGEKVKQFGYVEQKSDYFSILRSSDIVVSTANHEFFGVAMLEAVKLGALPFCPNRLVYPELYPKECLFNTLGQLKKQLKDAAGRPAKTKERRNELGFNFSLYSRDAFLSNFDVKPTVTLQE